MDSHTSVSSAPRDCWVTFDNGQGPELGKLVRLTRHVAVFEVYNPVNLLSLSQVLPDFEIVLSGRTIYSGRVVLRSLVNTGAGTVCEVSLADEWTEVGLFRLNADELPGRLRGFLESWRTDYRIRPEFKVAVTDLHAFLTDLKLWLDQLDLGARGGAGPGADMAVTRVMEELDRTAVPVINHLHERFEEIADDLEPAQRPAHQHLARRHLHPLYLCSPFGFRAFHKPLGYAGDYEMVNMILRDPCEGDTLFAKTMNLWLLRQYPSEAHRNRIGYLEDRLREETLRRRRQGGMARVLSLGCGPAHEVQRFLREGPLADSAHFTLLDMNDETLEHVRTVLTRARELHGRRAPLVFQKKSVLQLLRESVKGPDEEAAAYDFIYCAGLFDYLTDRTCKQLLALLHDRLAPGGLLVATNVDACRPFRHMLEFLLDWHLTYRAGAALRALLPAAAAPDECGVKSDDTGTNVFLEVRKTRTD
jgi:extracellular factor (EF) 3-hydroxypalmitic acid methyl ester biosynthesis protein